MAQYIDKAALIEEIERLSAYLDTLHEQRIIEKILSILNTIEVKEVDLEKEIDIYYNWLPGRRDDIAIIAKHFFTLGLKAQKGGNNE